MLVLLEVMLLSQTLMIHHCWRLAFPITGVSQYESHMCNKQQCICCLPWLTALWHHSNLRSNKQLGHHSLSRASHKRMPSDIDFSFLLFTTITCQVAANGLNLMPGVLEGSALSYTLYNRHQTHVEAFWPAHCLQASSVSIPPS